MFERGKVVKLVCDSSTVFGKSRTHQSFAKDADINVIINHIVTGKQIGRASCRERVLRLV